MTEWLLFMSMCNGQHLAVGHAGGHLVTSAAASEAQRMVRDTSGLPKYSAGAAVPLLPSYICPSQKNNIGKKERQL